MLSQPLMEKLLAMRWQGMVEGLKTQEQDRAIHELSFLERLSLLVDQQWNWRENQALERRLKAAKLRGQACVEDIDYRAARGLDKSVVRALVKDSAWVRNHENIFVIGPCGVGKAFSLQLWYRKLVATATRLSIFAPLPYCGNSP
jgi:DNA replication protein DnaC